MLSESKNHHFKVVFTKKSHPIPIFESKTLIVYRATVGLLISVPNEGTQAVSILTIVNDTNPLAFNPRYVVEIISVDRSSTLDYNGTFDQIDTFKEKRDNFNGNNTFVFGNVQLSEKEVYVQFSIERGRFVWFGRENRRPQHRSFGESR